MATKTNSPECRTCDGTGKIVVAKSWFPADGHSRIRCGICAGTGVSAFRCGEYEGEQAKLRQHVSRAA